MGLHQLLLDGYADKAIINIKPFANMKVKALNRGYQSEVDRCRRMARSRWRPALPATLSTKG